MGALILIGVVLVVLWLVLVFSAAVITIKIRNKQADQKGLARTLGPIFTKLAWALVVFLFFFATSWALIGWYVDSQYPPLAIPQTLDLEGFGTALSHRFMPEFVLISSAIIISTILLVVFLKKKSDWAYFIFFGLIVSLGFLFNSNFIPEVKRVIDEKKAASQYLLSIEQDNPQACAKIRGESLNEYTLLAEESCYIFYAESLNDPKVCLDIKADSIFGGPDHCLQNIAKSSIDPRLACQLLTSKDKQDTCLFDAIKSQLWRGKDASLCNLLQFSTYNNKSGQELVNWCVQTFAR